MEFTFGIITYNHEKFILELLESIKYQVITFGDGIDVTLVVSDDASKDGTVSLTEKWIDMNRTLFFKVIVLANKENRGVVENFKQIMSNIKDEHFKVIAGDDVFADNNVFKCVDGEDENNIVTYVPIVLQEDRLFLRADWYAKHFTYMQKKRTHRYDVKKQEIGSYFYTPCTFYRRKLYTKYYEGQSTYLRLFEDDPLWHAILSRNDRARVVFKENYLVLYRMHDNAICSAKLSPYAREFGRELNNYKKTILKEEKNILVKINLLLQIYSPPIKYLRVMNYVTVFSAWQKKAKCRYNKKCSRNYKETLDRLEKTKLYYANLLRNVEMLKDKLREA